MKKYRITLTKYENDYSLTSEWLIIPREREDWNSVLNSLYSFFPFSGRYTDSGILYRDSSGICWAGDLLASIQEMDGLIPRDPLDIEREFCEVSTEHLEKLREINISLSEKMWECNSLQEYETWRLSNGFSKLSERIRCLGNLGMIVIQHEGDKKLQVISKVLAERE